LHIESELLLPGEAVSAGDLRESCEARFDIKALSLLAAVERHIFKQQGPWSDEAHVSFKDIYELRELVQREGANEPSYWGKSLAVWE
jgi:hypothetical protein